MDPRRRRSSNKSVDRLRWHKLQSAFALGFRPLPFLSAACQRRRAARLPGLCALGSVAVRSCSVEEFDLFLHSVELVLEASAAEVADTVGSHKTRDEALKNATMIPEVLKQCKITTNNNNNNNDNMVLSVFIVKHCFFCYVLLLRKANLFFVLFFCV